MKQLILTFGRNGTELLGILSISAGMNLATGDLWKICPGLTLITGGILFFVAAHQLDDIYRDAQSNYQRDASQRVSAFLNQQFNLYFQNKWKLMLWPIAILLLVGGLAFYAYRAHLQTPASQPAGPTGPRVDTRGPKTIVHLSTSKNLWCTLSLIALDQNFFEDEGLDVQTSYQLAGRQNMDALVSKSVEFANTVEVNLAYQVLNGNHDLSVLGSIVSARDFAVVTKKSTGIHSAKDLVGHTLAFAPGTGAEMYVFALLQQNGIDPKKVKFKRIQPAALVDSLASSDIDAAASWEPFVSSMKIRLGSDAVQVATGDPYVGVMHVTVRREWLAQNQDTAVRFLRALNRAAELVRTQPEKAQEIVSRAAGLDMPLVKSIWNRFDFKLSLDQQKNVQLVDFVINTIVANEPEYASRRKSDLSGYFDQGPLQQVAGK